MGEDHTDHKSEDPPVPGLRNRCRPFGRPSHWLIACALALSACGMAEGPEKANTAPAVTMEDVEKRVSTGDYATAMRLIVELPAEVKDRADVQARWVKISEMNSAATAPNRAAQMVEEIKSTRVYAVQQTTFSEASELKDVFDVVDEFEKQVRFLAENSDQNLRHVLSPEQATTVTAFRKSIEDRQMKLFPALRAAYGKVASELLWSGNYDVEVRGRLSKEIIFTAPVFADRSEIKSLMVGVRPQLNRLRFSIAQFRAFADDDKQWAFTLGAPNDSLLGLSARDGVVQPLE